MASIERLTKRVKKMEEWIKENEDMGGPRGTLDTMSFLINEMRMSQQRTMQTDQGFNRLRQLTFEFVKQQSLTDEWDEFVQEQENAVQEQQTEEIPLQEEAQSGEEAIEAPVEEKEG